MNAVLAFLVARWALTFIGTALLAVVLWFFGPFLPVLEDWIWHFTLPPIAYVIVLVTAFTVQGGSTPSLFAIAGAVLLLLSIGIHNAWDSVTFTALNQRQQEEKREEEEEE